MKPRTRFYVYFDNVDVTAFVTPKLLEISMTSGVFISGETVQATKVSDPAQFGFQFRLAAPNHKGRPL